MFSGALSIDERCTNSSCDYERKRLVPFTHIELPIPQHRTVGEPVTLQKCLDNKLDSFGQSQCKRCGQNVKMKCHRLDFTPEILILTLQRLQKFPNGDSRKINDPVSFPESWQLNVPFLYQFFPIFSKQISHFLKAWKKCSLLMILFLS